MKSKSIITALAKREFADDDEQTEWIKGTTADGNEIVFWGNSESCVNLRAIEQQELPILVQCSECTKNLQCPHLMGNYYSVPENAIVTIYPYKAAQINELLKAEKDKNLFFRRLS
jgi:hypothetical protein